MNTNYQKIMENILKDIDGETLLLHSCCAPCSSYVIEALSNYFKITVFYYNPNISPIEEYKKRVEEQKRFLSQINTKYKVDFIESDYDHENFISLTKGLEQEKEGGNRCVKCYKMRLEKTASIALEKGYDYFCTTLSVSPYKNANKLNEIGKYLEEKYKVKYLYSDFKKKNGYKRSIELSKQYNLYRQDYCGCKFSKNLRKESIKL